MVRRTGNMKVRYDPQLTKKIKKMDVRIRKSFRERLLLFQQNHKNLQLHNHMLKREYKGHRSINITAGYRALYQEKEEAGEKVAYFIFFGTHDELYRKKA